MSLRRRSFFATIALMKERLIEALEKAAAAVGITDAGIKLDYPENPEHGDFSSNIAMAHAKKLGIAPRALAEKLVVEFGKHQPDFIERIEIAGPGFINFKVKDVAFSQQMIEIVKGRAEYGWGNAEKAKKIMVEYTDPNPFKVFHIGHLMSNAIGESISRLIQAQGAEVKRANWQGDVGPHVAKAVWGAMQEKSTIENTKSKISAASFWGQAYVIGAEAYDADPAAKKEIDAINKKIYERSDPAINELYDRGRKESLDAFEEMYKRLDTKFDNYFFEGTEGRNGETIVREFQKKGVFVESEGAVVFKGEDHGLHTRVFITSQGLPTYETKELGLNAEKFKLYPDLTESVIITANEQSDYFKVLLKVLSLIMPDVADKTRHISHGLMRFASGKMSSRKGNVISAESLIEDIKKLVAEKMVGREFSEKEADNVSDEIAIAAIKYTILRSSVGSDIIFDSAASISFEGDSGPYLQYSAVRAGAVLRKAEEEKIDASNISLSDKAGLLERLITRFPDIIARARTEYAPQLVANYLINLAGTFNSFYASTPIADKNEPLSPYRVVLTKAFLMTMTNGLWVLGIKVPKRM